jgi:hypothetical protein
MNVGWWCWAGGGELGGGVFGFPSLSFGDGVEEQNGSGWDVGVGGGGAFPLEGPVVGAVGRVDAGGVEELRTNSVRSARWSSRQRGEHGVMLSSACNRAA